MKKAILFVSSLLLLGSGCIVNTDGGGGGYTGAPGDITFAWSFNGTQTCGQVPDVAYIVITMPGQTIVNANGGNQLNCQDANGNDGITLTDFQPGTYAYTIDAYANGGAAGDIHLYSASGNVVVDGPVTQGVDLEPVQGIDNSYAYVAWDFATATGSAPQCGGEIDKVDITVDGQQSLTETFNCTDGIQGSYGYTAYVSAGQHTVDVVAYNSVTGVVYADDELAVTATPGQPSYQTFDLQWDVGGAGFIWEFNDYDATTSSYDFTPYYYPCPSGVDHLEANFTYGTNDSEFAYSSNAPIACGNYQSWIFDDLAQGQYHVYLAGVDANGTALYTQDYTLSPVVTVDVTAGVFPVSGFDTVDLYQQ